MTKTQFREGFKTEWIKQEIKREILIFREHSRPGYLSRDNCAIFEKYEYCTGPDLVIRVKIDDENKNRDFWKTAKIKLSTAGYECLCISFVLHSSRPQQSFDAIDFYGIEETFGLFEKKFRGGVDISPDTKSP